MLEIITLGQGRDVLEIEPATPYDADRGHYDELAHLAKKEHDADARPPIKNLDEIRAAGPAHARARSGTCAMIHTLHLRMDTPRRWSPS